MLVISFLFLIGCATVPKIETYQREDLKLLIGEYLKTYGDPQIQLHGQNYLNGEEYVELYWQVKGFWYKVVLIFTDDKWMITFDSFKMTRT